MKRAYDIFLNKDTPDTATASLAGRELPTDLVQQVSNLTMGQLFYILSHIQKLSAQAPVSAQALLAENPEICYALLHAECLAGMIEEPLLPMTADELQRTKAKGRRMREDLANHEIPPSAEQLAATRAVMTSGVSKYGGRSVPPQGLLVRPPAHLSNARGGGGHAAAATVHEACDAAHAASQPPLHFSKASTGPPPLRPPAAAVALGSSTTPSQPGGGLGGGGGGDNTEAHKQQLMQKLVQLTPEQIAQLPEHTKVQLLQFLQQHSPQGIV